MVTAEVTVGRLIEIRGRETIDLPEFNAFRTAFTDLLLQVRQRAVVIADLRGLQVISEPVYEALFRLMKMDSPMIGRFAYLIEPGSLLAVNVAKKVSAAANPVRKVCGTVEEAEAWLAADVTAPEQARLVQFLHE